MLTVTTDSWVDLIHEGEERVFGRADDDSGDILSLTTDPRVHRRAGLIRCERSGWTLANIGRWLHLMIVDVDGPGKDSVRPGHSLLVQWRLTRVVIKLGTELVGFEVLNDDHRVAAVDIVNPSMLTVEPATMKKDSGYFRVLVALCEPVLRDPSSHTVPTGAQIAVRLNQLFVEDQHLTAKGVERRLHYCRMRFGIAENLGVGNEVRAARQELQEVAITMGIVTTSDLDLLEPAI